MEGTPKIIAPDGTAELDIVTPSSVKFQFSGDVTVGFSHGLLDGDGNQFDPEMFVVPQIQLHPAGGAGQAGGLAAAALFLNHVRMIGDAPFKTFRGSVSRRTPIGMYRLSVQILSIHGAGGHPQFAQLTLNSRPNALEITA